MTALSGPGLAAPDGEALYAENCASCHGENLEGQPDWRSPDENGVLPAPPHDKTGHTWHHGDKMLFLYTKFGGQALMEARGISMNSGMPGFRETLSDDEINAILDYIKSTWPERERALQAQRTKDER
ncbi:c-type cytochrome [Shimia biformata]|uniref:c-type cytochrome n=1 Tax=Shimia biformata TaxID=1294299 RepID=UPI001EF286A5|nr:cytochrome c [Shimia biformata]